MTATATRTDIHRPSSDVFDPQAYSLIGCYYEHNADSKRKLENDLAVLEDNGLAIGHGGSTRCGHCGQHILYSALLVRDDAVAREFIFVGEQCLGNRFTLAKGEFQRLRKAAELGRKSRKAEEKLAKFLELTPFARVLAENGPVVQRNLFLSDLRRKLYEYGDLSPRQVSAGERAIEGEKKRAEWDRKRADEKAALAAAGVEAPVGRVPVEGVVVSCKQHEGGFRRWQHRYECHKLVVKTDAGWCCWATLPREFDHHADSIKGKRVKFVASLTRSDKDKTFAFGKRPSDFEIVVRN